MINNNDLQEAIISKLKADATLIASLATDKEVREAQWQGITFEYPCVRVALETQTPKFPGCTLYALTFIVSAMSEQESSKESNTIAYYVSETLKNFFSFGSYKFLMTKTDLQDAVRLDRTWVARVRCATLVYHA